MQADDLRTLADALEQGHLGVEDVREILREDLGEPVAESITRRLQARGSAAAAAAAGAQPAPTIDAAPAPARQPSLDPVSTLGRFRDVAPHARGGMGQILTAEDPELGRKVALKILADDPLTEEDRQANQRQFVGEARITGQLNHPNIIPVYELGEHQGRPYYAMPFVPGKTLADLIEAAASRPRDRGDLGRWLRLFLKVCDAVGYAHSRGVIHRDLKPENIMLGEHGEVLVMDWGVARAEGATDTSAERVRVQRSTDDHGGTLDGTIKGTPAYMPPEQALGEVDRIGPRSDVYSLGAMLYELLSLKRPFEGRDVWAILDAVAIGNFEPPSARAPQREIPPELEAIVLKAMSRRQRDRYASAAALREDIEAYLEDRSVSVVQYSLRQQALRWARRHKIALAGVLLAAVVAGAVGGLSWRADQQRAADELRHAREAIEAQQRQTSAAEQAAATPPGDDLRRWFEAQAEALAAIDQLAWGAAAAGEAGRAIDLAQLAQRRVAICRRAWSEATARGRYDLARSWVGRAGAGELGDIDRAAAHREIDQALARERERQVREGRETLHGVREHELGWRPGVEMIQIAAKLAAVGTEALAEMLLGPSGLQNHHELTRLTAIRALGAFSDRALKARISRALGERAASLELPFDAEELDWLCRAIVSLGDGAGLEPLIPKLTPGTELGDFLRPRLRTVPLPASMEDGGARAPRTAEAYLQRAVLLFNIYRGDEARRDIQRAMELAPGAPGPQLAWMRLHSRNKQTDLSSSYRALATTPHRGEATALLAIQLIYQERRPEALVKAREALQLSPGELACHRALCRVLVDTRNPEAPAALQRALALFPRDAILWRLLGRVYSGSNDQHRALAAYGKSVELAPTDSLPWLYRGMLHASMRDYTGAVLDLTRCLRNKGSHPSAYYHRGLIAVNLGRPERAVPLLKRATVLASHLWQAWQLLGRALVQSGGSRSEARAAFQQAIKHAPAHARPALQAELARIR